MYRLVYGVLYLFSLLPFFILYGISDVIAFLMYRVFDYRKNVVFENLKIAFPEKTEAEHIAIAKKFYTNLTDTFVETLKLLSISKAEFNKRAVWRNYDEVNALAAKGLNIQLHSGHQMNWEYAARSLSRETTIPIIGVYMRINSKIFERIMIKIRTLPNIILVPVQEFRNRTAGVFKNQYSLALVADQNPGDPSNAYWLNFLGKATPIVNGPEKGAKYHNPAIVFVKFVKLRRGYYQFEHTVVSESSNHFTEGELTRMFRDYLEEVVITDPANYLWSHRRWKHAYSEKYQSRWVDNQPPLV